MTNYQRLKDLREDHDLKQADIAKLLETTRQQIGKWENGIQAMGIDKYIKLAKYYNVSLDYLAGLTNVKTVLSPSRSCTTYIINLFEHLSTQNKERIEERMLEMLERQRNEK